MLSLKKFEIISLQVALQTRGIQEGGPVQKFIDSEVLRLTDPYVPLDKGDLKESGTKSTRIGSGEVIYRTPYARRQYYENKGDGLRGKMWFERMKANHKEQILRGALEMAGGKK